MELNGTNWEIFIDFPDFTTEMIKCLQNVANIKDLTLKTEDCFSGCSAVGEVPWKASKIL
jgi:hypothetical protein